MTTDNTEIDQELDEVTLDNNANEEQAIAEELSVEEQMALDLANEKDKYLRLFAEFENYKRRTTKERIELFKTANQEVLLALLPVLDDFDRAITEISKTSFISKQFFTSTVTCISLMHIRFPHINFLY